MAGGQGYSGEAGGGGGVRVRTVMGVRAIQVRNLSLREGHVCLSEYWGYWGKDYG